MADWKQEEKSTDLVFPFFFFLIFFCESGHDVWLFLWHEMGCGPVQEKTMHFQHICFTCVLFYGCTDLYVYCFIGVMCDRCTVYKNVDKLFVNGLDWNADHNAL